MKTEQELFEMDRNELLENLEELLGQIDNFGLREVFSNAQKLLEKSRRR